MKIKNLFEITTHGFDIINFMLTNYLRHNFVNIIILYRLDHHLLLLIHHHLLLDCFLRYLRPMLHQILFQLKFSKFCNYLIFNKSYTSWKRQCLMIFKQLMIIKPFFFLRFFLYSRYLFRIFWYQGLYFS